MQTDIILIKSRLLMGEDSGFLIKWHGEEIEKALAVIKELTVELNNVPYEEDK